MKVLLFGASGSAGGSVLRAALAAPEVDSVHAIVRRPLALTHDKLRVFIHSDYLNYAAVEEAFANVDACFFCLGISTTQVSGENEYRHITHDLVLAAAHALKARNREAAFHFISGRGTSLTSRFMWARVKAETERDLLALIDAVCWRPAFIDGESSENAPRIFNVLRPVFRLLKPFRSLYVSGQDIGSAMVQATKEHMRKRIIENPEIREIAARRRSENSPTHS